MKKIIILCILLSVFLINITTKISAVYYYDLSDLLPNCYFGNYTTEESFNYNYYYQMYYEGGQYTNDLIYKDTQVFYRFTTPVSTLFIDRDTMFHAYGAGSTYGFTSTSIQSFTTTYTEIVEESTTISTNSEYSFEIDCGLVTYGTTSNFGYSTTLTTQITNSQSCTVASESSVSLQYAVSQTGVYRFERRINGHMYLMQIYRTYYNNTHYYSHGKLFTSRTVSHYEVRNLYYYFVPIANTETEGFFKYVVNNDGYYVIDETFANSLYGNTLKYVG